MSEKITITYDYCLVGHNAIIHETRKECPLCELASIRQAGINFKYVLTAIEKIHDNLCPGQNGTWQDRVEQVVKASQASGLVAKKECTSINHDHPKGPSECGLCHGVGTISRDLTLQEAIEVLLSFFRSAFPPDYRAEIDSKGNNIYFFVLPSGERVEVKK